MSKKRFGNEKFKFHLDCVMECSDNDNCKEKYLNFFNEAHNPKISCYKKNKIHKKGVITTKWEKYSCFDLTVLLDNDWSIDSCDEVKKIHFASSNGIKHVFGGTFVMWLSKWHQEDFTYKIEVK